MSIEIIITDDDPQFRMMMQQMLEPTPHRITLCENGNVLIQALRQSDGPVVVYLDLYMDVCDGIKALEPIQSVDRLLRLRLVTGGEEYSAAAATLIAKSHGMNLGETLFKPFSKDAFMRALAEDTASLQSQS